MKRSILLALATLAFSAPAAHAGIWTAVPSGTTDEISALDYVSASRIVFTTTTGRIFDGAPGSTAEVASFAGGRQFFDVAYNPAATTGLAVADTGKLYRRTTGAWTPVSLANSTYDSSCNTVDAPYTKNKAPTANLLAIAWGSDTVAWIVSAERGQILKTTDAGATWNEVGQQADGSCRINQDVTDVATVTGSVDDVYFVIDDFAKLFRTADGLASQAQERKELVNCFGVRMRLAVDPAAANRVLASGECEGGLHQGFTADSGTTADYSNSGGGKLRGTAAAPGLFLTVGDAGKIEQTFDGQNVYQQPADGAFSTKDWRAVDLFDATHAAVAGVGGALVTTTQANTPPDLLAPTVQITGPDTAAPNAPVTLTAVATENAGGSGVKADGYEWTGTGLQPTNAATATYTFANEGTFTVTVKARDNAGNVSEAVSKTITVSTAPVTKPRPVLPGSTDPPLVGGAAKKKGKYVVFRVKGKLGLPAGVTAAQGCNGTMSISVYKGKKRLAAKRTTVNSKCRYKKTVKVKRSKVGRAKKLKLKVAFKGNSFLAPLSSTYKAKVR